MRTHRGFLGSLFTMVVGFLYGVFVTWRHGGGIAVTLVGLTAGAACAAVAIWAGHWDDA